MDDNYLKVISTYIVFSMFILVLSRLYPVFIWIDLKINGHGRAIRFRKAFGCNGFKASFIDDE
jgi:hypothetical protein